ncbi:hypothetical protein ASE74_17655 [Pedobacter sp. Leaf216]|nr:hypothetical protein ASE74_17655 [Pedobacter sp. Leaf216]
MVKNGKMMVSVLFGKYRPVIRFIRCTSCSLLPGLFYKGEELLAGCAPLKLKKINIFSVCFFLHVVLYFSATHKMKSI